MATGVGLIEELVRILSPPPPFTLAEVAPRTVPVAIVPQPAIVLLWNANRQDSIHKPETHPDLFSKILAPQRNPPKKMRRP